MLLRKKRILRCLYNLGFTSYLLPDPTCWRSNMTKETERGEKNKRGEENIREVGPIYRGRGEPQLNS